MLRVANDGTFYLIDRVASDTGLHLAAPYAGISAEGQPYRIIPRSNGAPVAAAPLDGACIPDDAHRWEHLLGSALIRLARWIYHRVMKRKAA